MPELTAIEYKELKNFVNHVMSWGAISGPYGDGLDITDKKGLATMIRVQGKLNRTIVIETN